MEKKTVPKEVIRMQERLDTETDPKRKRALAFSLCTMQGASKSYSELKTRPPNITFEDKLTIYGTKRTVELLPLAGHTASDVILYIPEEKIVFMSDLLFVNIHPYLASGSPEQWKNSLATVKSLGANIAVPGHGSVGKSADISKMLRYIQSLENIVDDMIKSGKSAEQVTSSLIPAPFDTWLCEDFFTDNLKFLCKLAISRKANQKTGKY